MSSIVLRLLIVTALAAGLPAAALAQDPPAPAEEILRQALAKLDGGDVEGAIADLEDLRDRGDAPPQGLAALGTLYLEIGLPRDALDVLRPLADSDDANPAVLYNAGRAALDLGEAEAGERYLERSVATWPVSPAARLLGLRLGGRGEMTAAYRLLRPWALANPDDEEAGLAAAAAALRLQRLAETEELLAALPEENPRNRLLSADLALGRRDPATAVELLAPLAAAPPPEMEVDVLTLLASAHLELGRSADAVALLDGKTAGRPRLALVLARARHQGGDVAAALETLAPFAGPALAADPRELPAGAMRGLAASIALEQGRLLLAAERPPEAATALERAAELDPWSREAWQELARARAAAGEPEKAEEALERFQELAAARQRAAVPGLSGQRRLTDTTGRRLAEAVEWSERGEGDKALAIIRQEIALAPGDLRARLLEVRTLLGLGRVGEALASASAAVERFPEAPDARHFRAVVEMALGDLAAAEEDLRRTLEQAPDHLPAKNDLALVLARSGRREEARRLLGEILAAHPDDPLARQRLEGLEAAETGAGSG